MRPVPDNAFERFVVQRKKDLQRIARHTGGEHQLTDVLHEAMDHGRKPASAEWHAPGSGERRLPGKVAEPPVSASGSLHGTERPPRHPPGPRGTRARPG